MSTDNKFENKINKLLDESVDNLDQDISRKLQLARYAAIEKAQQKTFWSFIPKPVAAALAVAAVSLTVYFNLSNVGTIDTLASMESDIEMLTANESLDFIEDIEFLEWLAESDIHAS